MGDVWKAIAGHPNYEVSPRGVVRNATTKLQLSPMRTGRAMVRLSTHPRIDRNVAHIVAEAFIGPRPSGAVLMHIDDDPYNNAVENLRWGTQQDNARDMAQKGRGGVQILSPEQVAEIRQRRAAGERGRTLAVIYGVSEQRICDIHKGRTTL